ncbi:MAG: glycoside hydrolase family 65 [Defluviitaleaceae bacterium]|nr:glycoside hydrolase family 65 [Defluviitaleaceae bacterium]MCL2836813.1 glycoside hydrolase family 65 [Defluviitaleaceae bacterium]
MIDRKKLVTRHNPILRGVNTDSPLTVGNGEFAFTADITGFQTLYNEYKTVPLCTMSQWGWHSYPGQYTLDDVKMTRYICGGREFEYAAEQFPETAGAYDWLRRNPHRLNLARIRLLWDGEEIHSRDITDVKQELDLYTGVLHSEFKLHGHPVAVRTVCSQNADVIGFSVICNENRLSVRMDFPYGSHKKNASDWGKTFKGHETDILAEGIKDYRIQRNIDTTVYCIRIRDVNVIKSGINELTLIGGPNELNFTVAFANGKPRDNTFDEAYESSADRWGMFWNKGGIADFSGAKDPRAFELERRMILSMYLTAVNCAGTTPPQETGLVCNSWYGKFHLEMHILHAGWFPLWGRRRLLTDSFPWYVKILDEAKENAARNGYIGARWPKMTGPEGIDSPSRIATLLIWQQPHILYMLELSWQDLPEAQKDKFLSDYWEIINETAGFMCGFVILGKDGRYHLPPPIIPAQEEHKPENVLNPAFELCYWRFGLEIAVRFAGRHGKDHTEWAAVIDKLAAPPVENGLYQAHQNCPDTFESYNRDHPSMLFGYGFIPYPRINGQIMSDTADAVLAKWDWDSAWGWDFALTAMTLTRLGRPEDAVDILLADYAKNSYVTSGNNFQRGRDDLPLYLPGNGSLLFALAIMLAGYGEQGDMPGFPKNGMWDVAHEGISPLPY